MKLFPIRVRSLLGPLIVSVQEDPSDGHAAATEPVLEQLKHLDDLRAEGMSLRCDCKLRDAEYSLTIRYHRRHSKEVKREPAKPRELSSAVNPLLDGVIHCLRLNSIVSLKLDTYYRLPHLPASQLLPPAALLGPGGWQGLRAGKEFVIFNILILKVLL